MLLLTTEAMPESCVINAIIGIKVTTTTHQFGKVVYLFNTFIGTPVRFRNKDASERGDQ